MRKNNLLTNLLRNPGPVLAASTTDDMNQENISVARSKGLDIAELRIDLYSQYDVAYVLDKLRLFNDIPAIATIRTRKEGGKWEGSEEDRLTLFKNIIPHIDAVDIESSAVEIIDDVISEASTNGKKHIIISYHNFENTPENDEIKAVIDTAHDKGADIIKIATYIRTQDDIRRLTSILLDSDKKLIVIGMGEEGLITRITLPAYGSLMTFCYLEKPTAPGQIALSDMTAYMRKLYPSYAKRIRDN